MALSERDCPHGRQLGKCADCDLSHMEMAAAAEARRVDELTALRKQDEALIRQLVEALENHNGSGPARKLNGRLMDEALSTQAQAGAVPLYRLLQSGVDRIEAADEFLSDDTTAWAIDPNGIFVGSIYGGHVLRPARRCIKGGQHGAE